MKMQETVLGDAGWQRIGVEELPQAVQLAMGQVSLLGDRFRKHLPDAFPLNLQPTGQGAG